MRLFVALQIAAEVRTELTALLGKLRNISTETKDDALRWVRPENLHVTLKFLGESPPDKLGGIRDALKVVHLPVPVSIKFRGIGYFPDEKRPRVLWVGIEASSNISTLAANIGQSLKNIGFPDEERKFTPHLTLARLERPNFHETLRIAIQENTAREFGAQISNDFHLIESKLKSSGAEYTTVQSFRFTAAEG